MAGMWGSIKKSLAGGVETAADFVEGSVGTGSEIFGKADDYVLGQAMGSGKGDSAWSKLSAKMGGADMGNMDAIARTGMESGVIGAGIGAVTGAVSDDQSILGGAFMGAAGGAALGAGSKALSGRRVAGAVKSNSKLPGKLDGLKKTRGRLRKDMDAMDAMQGDRTLTQKASDMIDDGIASLTGYKNDLGVNVRRSMRGTRKGQSAVGGKIADIEAKIASNEKVIASGSNVNPWATGTLAAGGSLAYATLDSNRY